MQSSGREVTIRVGFGEDFRDLTVRIPEGDIPPYHPDDKLELVGKRRPRVDGPAKVSGRARFTYDQNPSGLLHGRILRSPHPNADIKSVNLDAARALPGVKAAISFPEVFQTNSARFAWEGVAAVAADTEAQAEAALDKIEVEYEVLPFCVTREDAQQPAAPRVGRGDQQNVVRVYPTLPGRRLPRTDEERRQIDEQVQAAATRAQEAFATADAIVEASFETQVQTHSCLETHGVVCSWEDEKLICYCSTQATFGVRRELTHGQGPVKAADAEVRCEYMGGGFGSKFRAGREGVAGALLARQAGRPVKMMLDRREEQTGTGNRPDSRQEIRLGLKSDGEIVACRVHNWGTAGPNPRGAGARNHIIYNLGALDKVEYGVRTNCGEARPQRAPGHPQGIFALESILDMAAARIGMDPFELRKKNDDHPVRRVEYDIARQRSGWDTKRNAKPGDQKGIVKTGIGCASTIWYQAGRGGASMLVRIHRDGNVEVRNGAQDLGTGTRTIMGMVAAEELGIPLDAVRTFIGNTNDPRGPGSGGSATAPTLMPAARLAAHRAREQLLAAVGAKIGRDPAGLDLQGGLVVGKDGAPVEPRLTFKDACTLLDDERIEVLADRPILDRNHPNYAGLADTSAGVQTAEVEVDTETGVVRVKRVVAVQDSGKIINPLLAESQVRGGVIQGVSYALFERRIMDRQQGRMLNADLEHYKILGAVDCPEIEVVLLDVYMGKNNTHVFGLGEPPVIATAAAVANAVHNAIGARVTALPITPRRVLEALGKV